MPCYSHIEEYGMIYWRLKAQWWSALSMLRHRIQTLAVACLVSLASGCGGSSNGGGQTGATDAVSAVFTQTCETSEVPARSTGILQRIRAW